MTIEERLTRLERENRWLKRGMLIAGAVVASVFLMAQTRTPYPPMSSSFSVENQAGVLVGQFGVRQDGRAQRAFFEPAGGNPGPFRVLGVGPEYGGGGLLELGSYPNEDRRLILSAPDIGTPTIKAYDENGHLAWSVP
jgi:hypothetical protein